MRDVKNNVELGKVQPRKEIKPEKTEEVIQPVVSQEEKVTADFSNPTAEALGRSQVGPGSVDALKKDVAFGMAHPDAIDQADKFFNIALSQLEAKGEKDSYAKASELCTGYVNEFASK